MAIADHESTEPWNRQDRMARGSPQAQAQAQEEGLEMTPCTPKSFQRWLNQADRGDRLTYHEGFLALDRMDWVEDEDGKMKPERQLSDLTATAIYAAAKRGTVAIFQKRLAKRRWAYIAVAL